MDTQIDGYSHHLSQMTVTQIKAYAKSLGIKCPSMTKDVLVGWLAGVLWESQNGIDTKRKLSYKVEFSRVCPVEVTKPFVHLPSTPFVMEDTQQPEWLQMLRTHGVVAVPVPDFDPVTYRDELWKWMSSTNPIVTESDRSSWHLENLPPTTRGIFKNYMGHQEWMWTGREKCIPVFESIWGSKNLLSSFDGASIVFPEAPPAASMSLLSSLTLPATATLPSTPTASTGPTTFKNWFHYDQGRFSRDLTSIQGVLHLTDSGDMDGGFAFIENSHVLHSKYMDTHPSWGYKWEVIDINHPVYEGCRILKPRVKAGHILLFDSRLSHCFLPSRSQNYRMVMYVCLMPRSGANQKEIEKRQKIYSKNGMTGHWCYGPWFSENAQPFTPGRKQITPQPYLPPPIHTLSETRQNMIGI
jgi:hypothetical protein